MTAQEARDMAKEYQNTTLEQQAKPIYDKIEQAIKQHGLIYQTKYNDNISRELLDYLQLTQGFTITKSKYSMDNKPIYIINWEEII